MYARDWIIGFGDGLQVDGELNVSKDCIHDLSTQISSSTLREEIKSIITWLGPRARRKNQSLRCDWLTKWVR